MCFSRSNGLRFLPRPCCFSCDSGLDRNGTCLTAMPDGNAWRRYLQGSSFPRKRTAVRNKSARCVPQSFCLPFSQPSSRRRPGSHLVRWSEDTEQCDSCLRRNDGKVIGDFESTLRVTTTNVVPQRFNSPPANLYRAAVRVSGNPLDPVCAGMTASSKCHSGSA
jgi:hypothetical protein